MRAAEAKTATHVAHERRTEVHLLSTDSESHIPSSDRAMRERLRATCLETAPSSVEGGEIVSAIGDHRNTKGFLYSIQQNDMTDQLLIHTRYSRVL